MSDARRRQDLFQRALELEPAQRERFLDEECRGDTGLRAEVERLLSGDERAPRGFLPASTGGRGEARPGARIGGYEVLERIGEGGMGAVYAARQLLPRRDVALKLVRPGCMSAEALRRFHHEVEALGCLQHAGIAQIHEAGTAEIDGREQPYLAMELVRGVGLIEFSTRRSLDTGARIELLARVCDAVHHAHQRGVIHRDLKPDNVLVVDEESAGLDGSTVGQPKVLDFGIARLGAGGSGESSPLETRTGDVVGTLAYMSPEQVEGDPREIDVRTDVYALGVLLYELLAGRRPIEVAGVSIAEAARRIRDEDPTPLGDLDPSLRGDVTLVAARALAKDKELRYGSALDLAADLRRHLAGEPILAGPTSRIYRARKFVRRHRIGLAALAAVALALVAGLTASLAGLRRARFQRDRAEDALRVAERQTATQQAILDFLNDDVLEVGVPSRQGRGVTVREALERGALRVEESLGDRPVVAGAVLTTIGDTFRSLDELERAEGYLTRARELLEGRVGLDDHAWLSNSFKLAELRAAQGRFHESRALHAEVLVRRRSLLAPDDEFMQNSLNNLGALLSEMGLHEEAERLLTEALETRIRSSGADHAETLSPRTNLALLRQRQGRMEEAIALTEESLELSRRLLGPDDHDTLIASNNLASFYTDVGRFEEAEALYVDLAQRVESVYGLDHLTAAKILDNMVRSYLRRGRFARAKELVEETFAKMEAAGLGRVQPTRGVLLQRLAEEARRENRLEEAEAMAAEGYDVLVATLGEEHDLTLEAMRGLAVVYVHTGLFAEAEELLRRNLEIKSAAMEGRDPLGPARMAELADCLARMGRHEEAERWLVQALERVEAADNTSVEGLHARRKVVSGFASLHASWRPEALDALRPRLEAIAPDTKPPPAPLRAGGVPRDLESNRP